MSLSNTIKILSFAAFFLFPFTVDAAELKFADKTWEVNPQVSPSSGFIVRNYFDLETFIKSGFSGDAYSSKGVRLDDATLKILDEASLSINQETKPAKLILDDTSEFRWAKEFEPGQNGQALDLHKTLKLLANPAEQIQLPVLSAKPGSSLEETNTLGIKELVAVGESNFAGSPSNRRVNIKVGASRFQGLIIKPGEEFSFNKYLGDVDGEHGFLPELVIKKTGTVPEFGGGLCQVSSTAFRAAMNSGLPIVERRNHSYAVQYYAPQGSDATIYPGVTDLRFTNDLPSHLLIRTKIDGNKLYFEFYGTKDARLVTFDGPYQYDRQPSGAMKAIWTRWVEKDGEKTEQIFRSTYQSPALFHKTTQASTPNPQSTPEQTNPTPTPATNTDPIPAPVPTQTPTPTPTT
jgi:vancomycin resistance protein YoaR